MCLDLLSVSFSSWRVVRDEYQFSSCSSDSCNWSSYLREIIFVFSLFFVEGIEQDGWNDWAEMNAQKVKKLLVHNCNLTVFFIYQDMTN